MKEYHKIQSVYLRDPETKHRNFLEGQFSVPAFEYLKENKWVPTEKVDGTNIRVHWDGSTVTFGGRTDNAQIPAFLVNVLNEKFPAHVMYEYFDNSETTLYGEGYGAKIQKVGSNYKSDGVDFVLFDVHCGIWLERSNVVEIAASLDIDAVPILPSITLLEAVEMCREGFRSEWGDFTAEGLVLRPETELQDRQGRRVITKIKHKDFIK